MSLTDTPAATQGPLSRGEFRGAAGEYFGIWIVNILLTIVTLGIYSAWAKVRRNRYFYGNTYVDGHAFDYHARGRQILIGRIIVLVVFGGFNLAATFLPLLALITPLIFMLVLPWLFRRGIRFSARVTSYRNVRFDFVGTTAGAYKAVLLGGIVSVLSFGLAVPVASRWFYTWVFNNLRYGDRAFASRPRLAPIYMAWIIPMILIIAGGLFYLAVFVAIFAVAAQVGEDKEDIAGKLETLMNIAPAVIWIVMIFYLIAFLFYRVAVRNIVLNATVFDGRHRLFSDMRRLRYLWIVVSNTVVSVLTLGLMRPWAAVREQRYKIGHTGILIDGDMDEVMTAIEKTGPAASAEFLDMEGFDFGF
ncbi:YjgN family protein [Rhizobium halophytocola]|uniref:Uncharacterized membrane protein YjgN (DUF898 family) n=1 Tax=Rhizobium halophytocola TaxID=735519 RepID=A0ABS4E6L2_9HYPH|nr:DUF898 family protein [Rhizobium halophytocola]MBP1853566.1 uncharacterized membrane protein YjgN (DUF898 family) [Rhizobium halophytocola]